MPRFYPQNLKHLQQYHRPDRVNPRGDRIEIIFNKNGIEHLPFWSLCNKGNSDNADRSFFRKSASLPHHSVHSAICFLMGRLFLAGGSDPPVGQQIVEFLLLDPKACVE